MLMRVGWSSMVAMMTMSECLCHARAPLAGFCASRPLAIDRGVEERRRLIYSSVHFKTYRTWTPEAYSENQRTLDLGEGRTTGLVTHQL